MHRSRVITSWINTSLLTVIVALGIVVMSHHVHPATSASVTTPTSVATTPTTAARTSTTPHVISVSFRGDDGRTQFGDN
ncbi:MAG: hypothetical protein ACHQFZ_11585 [Acidimicrobiales bacterium]